MPLYSVNGVLTEHKPTVNVADFGFARGVTVFELARVYHGVPFYLSEHLDRLHSGAAQFGIAMPISRAELEEQVRHVVASHTGDHAAVKFYLTAGVPEISSGLSFGACQGFAPQLLIMVDGVNAQHPEAPYGLAAYQRGQRLKTVAHIRELPSIKTANYGVGFYAARQVTGEQYDDILFTTPDGLVTEATRSNVFAVLGGQLCTPKRHMLLGITRHVVLKLATQLGLNPQERDVTVADLAEATEVFTTGSIAELVPAGSLNDRPLPHTMDGPVFSRLRAAFSTEIAAHTMAHQHVYQRATAKAA